MKKLLTALCVVALVISACQKEPSYENPNSNPGTGGNTEGTQLVRIGSRVDNDSITLDYGYNALNRLSTINASGIFNGEPTDLHVLFNRNAANIITSAVLQSPFFVLLGLETDSVVIKYQYDQAAAHYLSATTHVVIDDEAQSDSTVFAYDGSGRLLSKTIYFDDGTGYQPDLKIDYEYIGNNLSLASYNNFDANGDLVLVATESFDYDSNINPLQFADEAPALSMLYFYGLPFSSTENFFSANSVTQQVIEGVNAQEPDIILTTYTYNSVDRPTKGERTDGSTNFTDSYYYQ